MINGKVEDRICGFGPHLMFYLDKDEHLKDLKTTIFSYLRDNFDRAISFVNRLELIREFYAEDSAMEDKTIESERGN